MKKSLVVSVTESDIRKGKPGSFTSCPIALALKRKSKTTKALRGEIRVGSQTLRLNNGKKVYLPSEAQDFIALFDTAIHVDPIQFKLDLNPTTNGVGK